MKSSTTYKPLQRSQGDHLIAGVCSGIAKVFNIDPTWVRITFLISLFVFKFSIVIYLILWLYLPKAPASQAMTAMHFQALPEPDQHNEAVLLQAPLELNDEHNGPLPPLSEMLAEPITNAMTPNTVAKAAASPQEPTAQQASTHPHGDESLTQSQNISSHQTPKHNTPNKMSMTDNPIDPFPSDFLATLDDEPTVTTSSKTTSLEEFPDDFMASFAEETETQSNNVTAIHDANRSDSLEEFPDDFMASFADETETQSNNVTAIHDANRSDSLEEFPDDFMASFADETETQSNTVTAIHDANRSDSLEELPDDFMASFADETETDSNNVTAIHDANRSDSLEEFPDDFLAAFEDEMTAQSQSSKTPGDNDAFPQDFLDSFNENRDDT